MLFNFMVDVICTRNCTVESCSTFQGVENIAQPLGPHKVFESTKTLAWLPRAYEHSHTQLFQGF